MNTEITDKEKFEGWVLYDADCRFCAGLSRRFRNALARRRFALLPLQTPWVHERLGLADAELLREMRLLKRDGSNLGGADALLEIGRHFWWARPFRQMCRLPAVMDLFRAVYRRVARNRGCANGACEIKAAADRRRGRLVDFLPLLVLPLPVLMFKPRLAPWVFMWAMAFTLYAGCKWLTYCEAKRRGLAPGRARALGYLLAWPGMTAAEFFSDNDRPAKPCGKDWCFAATKLAFGSILVWGMARLALPARPILAGWMGMVGAVFILHFGLFHFLSLAWRQRGTPAMPVMQNPLRAGTLAEFWGRRWNTAFNELAFRFAFRPLRRRVDPAVATVLVFGLSGLIHELVISLPARAGYGLPTLYFLLQGLGVVAERSRWGRTAGLGRGACGRWFTLLVAAGPVFWLFHPPFIKNVILPMLTAIGAT